MLALIMLSCKSDDKKSVENKVFIVSKFNSDIEIRTQEAISENPELATIKNVSLYDYPKGEFNFIILKDGTAYFYKEEYLWNWCGWGSDELEPLKRELNKDSLQKISYNEIYPLLKLKSLERDRPDYSKNPHHISFSFESDTVKNLDIYKLLEDIDSLGFHSYNVRKIAPFENKAILNK